MGFTFSNIHIRKRDGLEPRQVRDALCAYLTGNGYRSVDSEADADIALYILGGDGPWFSVCCEAIEFFSEQAVKAVCGPVSAALRTDVLASACFDSDLLFLNLINTEEGVDAWAKFGHDESKSFSRRNAFKPWTGRVTDINALRQIFKNKYVCAEEAWSDMEPLLGMPHDQGLFNADEPEAFGREKVSALFFRSTAEKKSAEPTRLIINLWDLEPCVMGQGKYISALNMGGASKGLAIALRGADDTAFRDVQLEYNFDVGRSSRKIIPLDMEKVMATDGKMMYYAALPNFVIPERVKDGLPMKKALDERFRRAIGVRFTPEGDPRKSLDICLQFVPLSRREGYCYWRVWGMSKSKKDYIEDYNASTKKFGHGDLLDPNDYDDVI